MRVLLFVRVVPLGTRRYSAPEREIHFTRLFQKGNEMLTFNRILFIASLSSLLFLAIGQGRGDSKDIALGLASFETFDEVGHSPFMVVRVVSQTSPIQSFGLSNEAGVLGMPLPPGNYCYDAFSKAGHAFQMNRPQPERCFSVRKDQVVEVGVKVRQ
jgi:hypothetical protein